MRPCARRHASSSKAAAYRDTNKAIRRNAERAVKPLRMRAAEKEVVVDDRPASCPRCVRRLRIFGQQDELRVDREDAERRPSGSNGGRGSRPADLSAVLPIRVRWREGGGRDATGIAETGVATKGCKFRSNLENSQIIPGL